MKSLFSLQIMKKSPINEYSDQYIGLHKFQMRMLTYFDVEMLHCPPNIKVITYGNFILHV